MSFIEWDESDKTDPNLDYLLLSGHHYNSFNF